MFQEMVQRIGLRASRSFSSVCLLVTVALLGCSLGAYAQEFKQAQADYPWSFPRDHGSHLSYQTEWWYYTGQLYGAEREPFQDAPEFGFQLTFFRKTEVVSGTPVSEYMAHAALTDIAAGTTYFSSRLGGGVLGLANVSHDSLNAASGDWTVDVIGEHLVLRFALRTEKQETPLEVRILARNLPPVWLQGVKGMSRKAACDECASMYYSMPRIPIRASVGRDGARRDLHGLAWMDHEFMTNSLSKAQVGWDWFGLMLKDGRSLMLFQLRDTQGGINFSSGGVQKDGDSRTLKRDDFTLTPVRRWRSPQSGVEYPVEWRIIVPSEGINLLVRARIRACEVGATSASLSEKEGAMRYWEGPVAAEDESLLGYLEMTGYDEAITRLMTGVQSPPTDNEAS